MLLAAVKIRFYILTRFPFHCQDRFLRYFTRGSENEVEKSNHDFHTVQITIGYYRPLYLDDEIEIGLKPVKFGNSSLTFLMGMFLTGSEELVGTCEAVWVYTNLETKKSAPIPEDTKAKLLGK